jgi:hypothetical protein
MAFMDFATGRGELLWSPRRPPITETAQDDRAGPKCATPNPMGLRVKIRRDIGGTWSVLGASTRPASNFPSLLASLDYARRECAAARRQSSCLLTDSTPLFIRSAAGHVGSWLPKAMRRSRDDSVGCEFEHLQNALVTG